MPRPYHKSRARIQTEADRAAAKAEAAKRGNRKRDTLTAREKAFIEHYLASGKKSVIESYIAVNPAAANWTEKTQKAESSRLARRQRVKVILDRADVGAVSAMLRKFTISKNSVATEMARMAFAIATPPDGVALPEIAPGIPVFELGKTGSKVMSYADKRQALRDLAQLMGYMEEKKQVRFIRSMKDLSEEELAALASEETTNEREDAPADDEADQPEESA